jgi:hypothetical protein
MDLADLEEVGSTALVGSFCRNPGVFPSVIQEANVIIRTHPAHAERRRIHDRPQQLEH